MVTGRIFSLIGISYLDSERIRRRTPLIVAEQKRCGISFAAFNW